MSDLFAGYANYASTEAILQERLSASAGDAGPDSSITVTVSASWSWSITFTWTI
ncbi:hypothetical protein OG948_31445 [Embleya sp. NBC_00888]|uniref:hypothetical protein n=1 Tax=Embleya sp. NBC_00888 TaxID=2975960 RepID=UPI003865DF34|nr:hypothetical protein OG948_31445 [Embleya sp. NBC_00888]